MPLSSLASGACCQPALSTLTLSLHVFLHLHPRVSIVSLPSPFLSLKKTLSSDLQPTLNPNHLTQHFLSIRNQVLDVSWVWGGREANTVIFRLGSLRLRCLVYYLFIPKCLEECILNDNVLNRESALRVR